MKRIAESMIVDSVVADSRTTVIAPQAPLISMAACLRLARKALVLFACGAASWMLILRICGII